MTVPNNPAEPGSCDELLNSSDAFGRKAYSSPKLHDLGDVRDLTLGGSPGLGDSGAAFSEDPP